MAKEKSRDILAFESQTQSMVKNSRHYVEDMASLQRRIKSLEMEITAKQEILGEFRKKLERQLQQSQTKLF